MVGSRDAITYPFFETLYSGECVSDNVMINGLIYSRMEIFTNSNNGPAHTVIATFCAKVHDRTGSIVAPLLGRTRLNMRRKMRKGYQVFTKK